MVGLVPPVAGLGVSSLMTEALPASQPGSLSFVQTTVVLTSGCIWLGNLMRILRPLSTALGLLFAGLLIAVLIVLPVASSVWLFSELRLNKEDKLPFISFTDFVAAGAWIQAIVAWTTFIVTAVGASSILLLWRQLKLDRERAERELFRLLISADVQSVKRVLHVKSIRKQLDELATQLDSVEAELKEQCTRVDEYNMLLADACRPILERMRARFNQTAAKIKVPLLEPKRVSLDHVEALINEYNYLSKLILDKRLRADFHTELGQENFRNVHGRLLAFIRLRQNISPKYAVHFTRYVEARPGWWESVRGAVWDRIGRSVATAEQERL